jgi:hypothetical protein
MNLEDFVADVIGQLQRGVQKAIDDNKGIGKVNAIVMHSDGSSDWNSSIRNIEFDISVTASEKAAEGGHVGVHVYVLKGEAGASKAQENTMVNKIRFTIPIFLPSEPVSLSAIPSNRS